MLLITHAITGAALSSIQKSIPGAFAIGLVSHYLLDIIPHYDHNVESFTTGDRRGIRKTLGLIALDGLASVVFPLLLFWPETAFEFWKLFAAIVAYDLPDLLQGFALVIKNNRLLNHHQAFQEWIHTKVRINHIPYIAIPLQIGFNLVFIFFAYYLV